MEHQQVCPGTPQYVFSVFYMQTLKPTNYCNATPGFHGNSGWGSGVQREDRLMSGVILTVSLLQ